VGLERGTLEPCIGSLLMVFGVPPPKPVQLILILGILSFVFTFLRDGVGHVTPSPSLLLLLSLAAT
jgi:hypothetical protein